MNVVGQIAYTKILEIGIGEGMNSRVYLADEPQHGGKIAVKEIPKDRFGNDVSEYFAEAQAMFLADHENILRIQYACETDDHVCLAMPFYQKGSLTKRISDRPLRLREVLRISQGILAGLAQIHREHIHFDIKPSNVLFSDTDVPMIADFGQARRISPTGTVTAPPLYSLSFPPETATSAVGTVLSDIYQAGLLIYRALNGNPWFESQIPKDDLLDKIAAGRFPNRQSFMPHVPPRLRTFVRKALRIDPDERYQSATEMADALARVPLDLDWIVEPYGAYCTRWTAPRVDRSDLIVELLPDGSDWSVRVFTQRAGGQSRRKNPDRDWRDGMSFQQALDHLKDLFERLRR